MTLAALCGKPALPLHRPRAGPRRLALNIRTCMWLLGLCLLDANATVMVILLGASFAVDFWFARTTMERRTTAVWRRLSQCLRAPPPQAVLFALLMLFNVACQTALVDTASQPYMMNILALHTVILAWACTTTPRGGLALAAVHHWSKVFISVLTALIVMQVLVREIAGEYVDLRFLITGQVSRSGITEGTVGVRPTSVFEEPSNHAIMVFMLLFVNRLTGPRRLWLSAVTLLSCLLSHAGIGLMLALYLLLDGISSTEARSHLRRNTLAVLTSLIAVAVLCTWFDVWTSLTAVATSMTNPETRYDPVAVRLFIPELIANFTAAQHLVGTGLTNYASLPEGLTQYDSSFALGVYYQAGVTGLALMLLTVRSVWHKHSARLAIMVMVLFATKLSLIVPAFWGVAALLECQTLRRRRTRMNTPLSAPLKSSEEPITTQVNEVPNAHRSRYSWLGLRRGRNRVAASGAGFDGAGAPAFGGLDPVQR